MTDPTRQSRNVIPDVDPRNVGPNAGVGKGSDYAEIELMKVELRTLRQMIIGARAQAVCNGDGTITFQILWGAA